MAIPKLDLRLHLLKLLYEKKDKELSIREEIVSILANRLGVSSSELEERYEKSGAQKFLYMVWFSRLVLVKIELAETVNKGTLKITKKGEDFLNKHTEDDENAEKELSELEYNYRKSLAAERKKQKSLDERDSIEEEDVATVEEILTDAKLVDLQGKHREDLKFDFLEMLRGMEPYRFQDFVVKLFEKMGYGEGKLGQKGADAGIDGIMRKDRLGLDQIYLQTKRYKETSNIRRGEISQFRGDIDRFDRGKGGAFVVTSDFTDDAREQAVALGIILIDGDDLFDFCEEFSFGLKSKPYVFREIDEEFFKDYAKGSDS